MKDNPIVGESALNWNTRAGKTALVRAVFQHLKDNPEERSRCLDYEAGYEIVQAAAKKIGMEVPSEARVLFLPEGDWEKGEPPEQKTRVAPGLVHNAGSSLIIDLPPEGATAEESLKYACTYVPW